MKIGDFFYELLKKNLWLTSWMDTGTHLDEVTENFKNLLPEFEAIHCLDNSNNISVYKLVDLSERTNIGLLSPLKSILKHKQQQRWNL